MTTIEVCASEEYVLIDGEMILDRLTPDEADALALRLIRCATEAREYVSQPFSEFVNCMACDAQHTLGSIAANNDHCPTCGEAALPF